MLELRIDNKPYDLQAKSAMNLRLQNPALDTESLGRAYSYPFKVPHSPRNLRNLQHRHRLDATQNLQFEQAEIRLAGVPFLQGRAKTEEHSNESTEVTFQNNDLSSIVQLDQVKIREVVGMVNVPQPITAELILTPVEALAYQMRVDGIQYLGGDPGDTKDVAVNKLVDAINEDYPGIASYNILLDQLIFQYTTDIDIAPPTGLYTLVSELTLADAREKNMQNFIAASIATPRNDISFPVTLEPDAYGSNNVKWGGYYNWAVDSNFYTNERQAEERSFRIGYKPFVRLSYVLEKVAQEVGLSGIEFDVAEALKEDLDSLLIYNNYSLDEFIYERSITDDGFFFKMAPQPEINLANHVPDYTAKELIVRIAKFFNLYFSYRDNRLYFKRSLDQIDQAPLDWTKYTDPNFDRTATDGGGVTIEFDADISKQPFTGDDAPKVVGDGANTITLPAQPIYYRSIKNSTSDPGEQFEWEIAWIEVKATNVAYDTEHELETLRLMFDNGTNLDEGGREYLKATPIGKAFDLIFTTEDRSLYDTWWKGWTDFLFSPVITRLCWLPISEVLRLSTWEKAFVKIYHPDGECLALIRSAQIRAGTDGISAAKIEFQRKM